jgi:uncharacterized membrane protein
VVPLSGEGTGEDITNVQVVEKMEEMSNSLSPGRIEALSDGVIAIAITLLALELSIPHLSGGEGGEAATSLGDMSGELYMYAIGFMSLGVYWSLHHYVFHFIKRSDGILVWLNIIFLSMASLVPFFTALNNENPDTPEAVAIYGVAMAFTMLTIVAIWIYATWNNRLVSAIVDKELRMKFLNFMMIGIIIVMISGFGSFLEPAIGYLLFVGAAWFIYWTALGHKHFKIEKPSS